MTLSKQGYPDPAIYCHLKGPSLLLWEILLQNGEVYPFWAVKSGILAFIALHNKGDFGRLKATLGDLRRLKATLGDFGRLKVPE